MTKKFTFLLEPFFSFTDCERLFKQVLASTENTSRPHKRNITRHKVVTTHRLNGNFRKFTLYFSLEQIVEIKM